MWNLGDLARRAAQDVIAGRLDDAASKLDWSMSFHRLISHVALLPQQFELNKELDHRGGGISLHSSPALSFYMTSIRGLDNALVRRVGAIGFTLDGLVADRALGDPLMRVMHRMRCAANESLLWEEAIAGYRLPSGRESYRRWIRARQLRSMVYGSKLKLDSCYMQFRALHQIPELLAAEANSQFVKAIENVGQGALRAAHENIEVVIALMDGIVASMLPLIDNMSTADYHHIRENLGPSSGIQSVALYGKLFGELSQRFDDVLRGCSASANSVVTHDGGGATARGDLDCIKWDDAAAMWSCFLFRGSRVVRSQIARWRDYHLALPRHNLGSGGTRSMIGSRDAVKTVERMRDASKSPNLQDVPGNSSDRMTVLSRYYDSPKSLYNQLLSATGVATRRRFPDIQALPRTLRRPIADLARQ